MNNPRNLALAGAGVAAAVYFLPFNFFNTPATKTVDAAFARAGEITPRSNTKPSDEQDVTVIKKKGKCLIQPQNLIRTKTNVTCAGIHSDRFQENIANQRPGEVGQTR